jgi:GNAT superfamily N-acetyltransferase/RimJ/RimL family protein N-acetyltransferase
VTGPAAARGAFPTGIRVRPSTDADIEREVEFSNRWATPSGWQSPAIARSMRHVNPEPDRLGLIAEDTSGAVVGLAITGDGGLFRSPDGSWRVSLRVSPESRRRGLGTALLEQCEAHAKGKGAARAIAAVRGNEPEGARFAEARGYRAFHERIDSYIDVAKFDASTFEDPDATASRAGIRLATYQELMHQHRDDVEAFQRELLPVIWSMARDVPSPTPMPEQPPPFEQAKRMFFEGPGIDPPGTILALRDGVPVGMTATQLKENGVAYTNFTGVARTERRKGLALAMKLRALRSLKERGVKLFGTTNDEQNAAMRGINRRLGYVPDPPTTMYEKRLA